MLIFLLLLLFATQVLLGLYASTVVTSAGYDAARQVAGARTAIDEATLDGATAAGRRSIGALGRNARFDWHGTDEEVVRLRVDVERPHLLPAALVPGGADISRTLTVRRERTR